MSPRGWKNKPALTKIAPRAPISPHDLKFKLDERDRLAASDTERWLGDSPPYRSALAQRDRR
jgi:hypothetical protein